MISERISFICECFLYLLIRVLEAQQTNRLINCRTISNDTVQYTCGLVSECHSISAGVIHICEKGIKNGRQFTKICCPGAKKMSQRRLPIKDSVDVVKSMCKIYSEARYRNVTIENPKYGTDDLIIKKILDCFEKESLIVGGQDAGAKEFPHMARIGYGDNANDISWRCGGSLISEYFVLSAAHCVDEDVPNWVRLGDLNYSSANDDANSLNVRISERIVHPNYRRSLVYNDIVLFKLEKKVKFNAYVRPVCLHTIPTVANLKENPLVSGWGNIGSGEPESSQLLKAAVTLASDETCRLAYRKERSLSTGFDSKSMVCVLDKSGKDSCSGDSGGPLQIHNKDYSPCMYDQIGIVSLGSNFCGDGKTPAIYTKVANYIEWIQNNVWP